jgi:hypothetical protein
MITVKIHGNTEHVTHPMIDLYEGKPVRIHDDLTIYTAGGGTRIGTGSLLVRMRAKENRQSGPWVMPPIQC